MALGVLAYVLWWGPVISPRFVLHQFRWRTLCSTAIAASGAIIPYSGKLSSALVFLGGLDWRSWGYSFPNRLSDGGTWVL